MLPALRAFAASKAFQGGVSLDQIISDCHWKAQTSEKLSLGRF